MQKMELFHPSEFPPSERSFDIPWDLNLEKAFSENYLRLLFRIEKTSSSIIQKSNKEPAPQNLRGKILISPTPS